MRQGISFEQIIQIVGGIIIFIGIVIDFRIVRDDLAVLAAGDTADPETERKTDDQQHAAARHTDRGDQDAVPIGTHVQIDQPGIKALLRGSSGFLSSGGGHGAPQKACSRQTEQRTAAKINCCNGDQKGAGYDEPGIQRGKALGSLAVGKEFVIGIQNDALQREPGCQNAE